MEHVRYFWGNNGYADTFSGHPVRDYIYNNIYLWYNNKRDTIMNQQQLVKLVEDNFGTCTKFFRWLGVKHPNASSFHFRKTNYYDYKIAKIMELYIEDLKNKKNIELIVKARI